MGVTIVGLGAREEDLTLGALRALEGAERVYVRTALYGIADVLDQRGIAYSALDHLYEACDDFDQLCRDTAHEVTKDPQGVTVYAVPGGASIADETVRAVYAACRQAGIACAIMPGVGWEARAAASAGGLSGMTVSAAGDCARLRPDPRLPLVVVEIDSRQVAGEVKLRLMEAYPAEHRVLFCGEPIPLFELDRQNRYAHDTSVVVPPLLLTELERFDIGHLCEIMALLRDPQKGCPWDREQTHASLKQYLIEEAYEALDAIDAGDPMMLADELGDVLLQVAFHAQIGAEHGAMSMEDVTSAICAKMISRHTHIFGEDIAHTPEEVLARWEINKRKEKGHKTDGEALLGVSRGLPAAMRAQKVLRKAGMDADREEALQRVRELAGEMASSPRERSVLAGDFLLAAVNLVRICGEPAEQALDEAVTRFAFCFLQNAKNDIKA